MVLISTVFRNSNLLKCRLCQLSTSTLNRTSVHKKFLTNCNKLQKCFISKYNVMTTATLSDDVLFKGKLDRFNGVTVDSTVENCDLQIFTKKLEDSLKSWTEDSKRGIWFKVALEHAEWVPILAKNGFNYHHARDGFVMMYKWLPKDESNNIPPFSHTMLGVGAIVVNDKSQLLVVREKYWLTPHWKLPGGYVEPGENIIDAAIREVYEETNITTEFHSVINMRHGHNGMFETSDLYVVVCLKPLSNDIVVNEREIAECKWLDINEYMNHPHVHDLNKFFITSYLEYEKNNFTIECKHGIHQILKKPYTVYFVKKQSEQ